MNITLKPEQAQFIQQKLNSGKYSNADEVIVEAFRLLDERDREYQKWVEEMIFIPEPEDDSGLPYWEMFTPEDMVIKVGPNAKWSYTR